MITLTRLQTILDDFRRLTIGLVGDLFLDRYLEIEAGVRELSVETGIEAYQVGRVRNSPGALGTILNNLSQLGIGMLRPVTVLGDDGHGYELRKELEALCVDGSHIIQDANRLTPTYTKPLEPDEQGGWRELNRLDIRSRAAVSQETVEKLCGLVRHVFESTDGLIVLDQISDRNQGVVTEQVQAALKDVSQADPQKIMLIDSRAHLGTFDFGNLKGNRSELLAAAGESGDDEAALRRAAARLANKTGRTVFGTLGPEGILIAPAAAEPYLVPGFPVTGPIDIVGAGDSASSALIAALLSGATEQEAATIANLVASITVQQLGTTGTASQDQILSRWHEWQE